MRGTSRNSLLSEPLINLPAATSPAPGLNTTAGATVSLAAVLLALGLPGAPFAVSHTGFVGLVVHPVFFAIACFCAIAQARCINYENDGHPVPALGRTIALIAKIHRVLGLLILAGFFAAEAGRDISLVADVTQRYGCVCACVALALLVPLMAERDAAAVAWVSTVAALGAAGLTAWALVKHGVNPDYKPSGLDTNVDWSDGSLPIARGGSSLGTGLSAIALSYAIGPAMPSSLNALRRPHMFPVAAVGAHGIACLASVAYAAVAFSAVGGSFPRHLASAVAPSAALNAAAALRAASLVLAALVVVHPVLRGLEDALEGRDCGDTEASVSGLKRVIVRLMVPVVISAVVIPATAATYSPLFRVVATFVLFLTTFLYPCIWYARTFSGTAGGPRWPMYSAMGIIQLIACVMATFNFLDAMEDTIVGVFHVEVKPIW